jgi:hypothetical protein
MDFLRRLLGLAGPDEDPSGSPAEGAVAAAPEPHPVEPERPTALSCPSCAFLLDPPPVRNRLCPRCRQPIVVRRVDGRLALLTESAVTVFEAARQREVDERTWKAARLRWLRLARNVKASPARRAKLAAARLSADVVQASRALYLSTAERAVRAARHRKRWGDVGRIRREQAEALYLEAGSPVPPPAEIAELHREGMIAVLRSLLLVAKDVELVSAGCCPACRADDGKTFRIASEVGTPRLPHAGCPRGLCGCDWWPAVVEPGKRRRRAPATARPSPSAAAAPAVEPTPAPEPDPGT